MKPRSNAPGLALIACAMVAWTSASASADEPDWPGLERQFRTLPIEARHLTGPLFWLHGDESREQLECELQKVAEGGNGTFTAESRPHRDWLGEGWYRDLDICLQAAKKLGLTMWIFDEKWWPSGEVGGQVPPRYAAKLLNMSASTVQGPCDVTLPNRAEPNLVAVLAGRVTPEGIDGASLVDLTDAVSQGQAAWKAPSGPWKVMTFTWTTAPPRHGRYLLDGASADCSAWYIQTVYQPHYDRFKDEFGKTIVGFFYDEPETPGDWGTEVRRVLDEHRLDWKKALVAWKGTLAGEEQTAARYAYMEAFAEAWGRTLYGGITAWCHDHGVRSFGHFLEHDHEYLRPDLCAGDMIRLQKYSDMGAIDAVFRQFVPGRKDDSTYQTPKLGSSISHAYGKTDDLAMVEIFGARGQDLTYPEMKWWTDLMQVGGINFHIPHSFNPRAPYDTDCPPYFFNGGYEPRWPLYRVYADYTSRLSLMLTGGRHVAPVAVLYLGLSSHVGQAAPPERLTTALQEALFDCDWLPADVLEQTARIEKGRLGVGNESYRVLIVPSVEVVPYATLVQVQRFFEQGGIVVGCGTLPSKSATLGKTAADIAAVRSAIWGDATPGLTAGRTSAGGGRAYFLPAEPTAEQLVQVLSGDAGVHPTLEVVKGDTAGWLRVLHRQKLGHDLFLVCNQDPQGPPRPFRFRVTAADIPECWDPMRNELTSVPFTRGGGAVLLDLTLEPNESVLLVFQQEARPLPMRLERASTPLGAAIAVVRQAVPRPVLEPPKPKVAEVVAHLSGCPWVWYPEGDPARSAPPGTRYFRKRIDLPADRPVERATFVISADNTFVLHVNGQRITPGSDAEGDWHQPAVLDVTNLLKPGPNVLAIAATNLSDRPNPAGLLGRLDVAFHAGKPVAVPIDATWRVSRDATEAWTALAFDEEHWPLAKVVAPFGGGPWGALGDTGVTLSPVTADPFVGVAEVPTELDLEHSRVYLELDALAPEAAARVAVNDRDAGGFIGPPLRLEVTPLLHPGTNTIRIEPFAPGKAVLKVYPG